MKSQLCLLSPNVHFEIIAGLIYNDFGYKVFALYLHTIIFSRRFMPKLTISDGPPRDMSNFIVMPKILFGFSKEGHIFWFCTPTIGQNFINDFSYSYKFTRYCKKNVAMLCIISPFFFIFWKYFYQLTTSYLQRAITPVLYTVAL